MLGLSGVSSDMREIEGEAASGNERALMALKMYNYRVKKYIGAYTAAMGGIDILIFTGGIGENADTTRHGVCKGMEFLGLEIDESKNTNSRGEEMVISNENARAKIIIVPTAEELVIAQDTQMIIDAK